MVNGVLEVRSQGGTLSIGGDTGKILANRYARLYMRRNLDCTVDGGAITIRGGMGIDELMGHVRVLAKYAKCEISYDGQVGKDLQDFNERERLFREFSEKARDIRDNHPAISEFSRFRDSLTENMPNRRLYPLQLLSAYHMAFAQNECNFSVPGAGKTSVVYGAFAYLSSLPEDSPKRVDCMLVVGPLSSFGSWEGEYTECFGKSARAARLISRMGRDTKAVYLHSLTPSVLTLTSYQSVISLKEDLKYFIAHHRVMVVLDEAHKVKNTQGAITAESTMELAACARSRIVLTGTPAPNGYEDLSNLFRFIWPDRKVISYNVPQLQSMSKATNDPRVPDLIRQISPFFIRIRKSDLSIPEATSEVVRVEMSESQRSIYDTIEEKMVSDLEGGDDSPYIRRARQAKVIRLLQVATNPDLLNQSLGTVYDEDGNPIAESEGDRAFIGELRKFISDETPAKFTRAAGIVRGIIGAGGRAIIWTNFIRNIERMGVILDSIGIPYRQLYGATPVEGADSNAEVLNETRESIVREFNSKGSTFSVIIANPLAVAESISLHRECHNAVYLDRSFNAAQFIQSKDRIHRYGLPAGTATRYYYLVSAGSIDEAVNTRLDQKERRLNGIMESMPIPLFDNTLEAGGIDDIKAIIAEYESRTKKV